MSKICGQHAPRSQRIFAPTLVGLDSDGRYTSSPRTFARRSTVLSFAAAALVVLLGLGGWLLASKPWATPSAPPEQLVAEASGANLGINVSVLLTPHARSLGVQVTLRGLEVGGHYDVLVVTGEGRTLEVSSFVGESGEQVVRADLKLSIDEVSFFALVRSGGEVLVTVPFAGAGASETGGGAPQATK